MLSVDEILNKTEAGLYVFKYYLPFEWKVGKNFQNPFYDDTKASCNVYFDNNSNRYRFNDFGNTQYSGDCFNLVAIIKGLNIDDKNDFKKVLEIITNDLTLITEPVNTTQVPKNDFKPIQKVQAPTSGLRVEVQPFTATELSFWTTYGIDSLVLQKFNVKSIQKFTAVNKDGKDYSIISSLNEPIFGYFAVSFAKIYRPNSKNRFLHLGEKPENYIFGLDHLPPRGDVLFITGGEKDVLSLSARNFHAIAFNSETATIPIEIIQKLSYRFRHIVILYDLDKTGMESSLKHQSDLKDFDVKALFLPLKGTKDEKDISDYFKLGFSSEDFKRLFNKLLENIYAQTFAMLKSCEIDFENPPLTPEPLISIQGVTIGSSGNLLGITGGEGSGKSNYLGGIIAGTITSKAIDTLGTSVRANDDNKAVLYFDTEQSEDQLYRNMITILKRSSFDKPPIWFKAYCLTNLSRKERLQVIIQSVDKFHHQFGGVHLIVIDGIGDLIGSLNDERESIYLIEELHRMAGIYKTCILCVLHLVPNGIKLRGHLGSELQRKSAGILCIEKDENTDVSSVKALKVRSGSPLDVPIIQFAWDKSLGHHVYFGEKSKDFKNQRKIEDLKMVVKDVFTEDETLSYTELTKRLLESMEISPRTAKNYIKFMIENSIIEKCKKGTDYQLFM